MTPSRSGHRSPAIACITIGVATTCNRIYVSRDTTGVSGEIPERCLFSKAVFRLIEISRSSLIEFEEDTNFIYIQSINRTKS